MKKIINKILVVLILAFATTFVSCEADDQATDKGTLNVATGIVATTTLTSPLAVTNVTKEAEEKVYSFTVTLNKPQVVPVVVYVTQIDGTADENDFSFESQVTVPAYTTTAKGSVTILNDSKKEGDETFTLQIGDLQTANATATFNKISFVIKDCYSDLAGTYTYVTTNCYTPGPPAGNAAGPFTGSVTLVQTSSGVYSLTDASFGGWLGLYGPQTPATNNTANGVTITDFCGKLGFGEKDQYGEIFTFSNLVISGANMSFKWTNDYGEYGSTVLTRTDGTSWPALTL